MAKKTNSGPQKKRRSKATTRGAPTKKGARPRSTKKTTRTAKIATTARSSRHRDDFPMPVLRRISHEVRLECSNPDCRAPTHGPSRQKGISNVGVGAHITAAAPGGPRYDATLSADERRSESNAMWLCNSCGRLIDNDTSTYTVVQLRQWKRDAIDRAQKALASGGRSTAQGLLAEHLEIQKQALAHQWSSREAQMRDQQLTRFSEMYSRFLDEAKTYADAIEEYGNKMYRAGYKPDRPTREVMRRPITDATASMHSALQPILLADSDEARSRLRWELIRRRGFEPTIDTTDNQKAYAAWIHYHLLRLRDGITSLQDNVREALGHPARVRSEASRTFIEQSIADAKVKAEAVDAEIKVQFDTFMREHQARAAVSTPGRAPNTFADSNIDEVRNRVWNVLHVEIFEDDEQDDLLSRRGTITLSFLREIWTEVLSRPIDEIPNDFIAAWKVFRQVLMTCAEPTFNAIVQHAGRVEDIRRKLVAALEHDGASHRFVGDELLPRPTHSKRSGQ